MHDGQSLSVRSRASGGIECPEKSGIVHDIRKSTEFPDGNRFDESGDRFSGEEGMQQKQKGNRRNYVGNVEESPVLIWLYITPGTIKASKK
jgi:hypothetical protein